MGQQTVLICGAGIAGPTLAYWLLARGFVPTIVEQAADFREGGYVIDFWGAGYNVAERMGLLPALCETGYLNDRIVFVSADGRERSAFGGRALRHAMRGRFLSIQRSDLARHIFLKVADEIETLFADEAAGLVQDDAGVDVRFKSGRTRRFDLVVGADGLHSKVRSCLFGIRKNIVRYLGYYVAAFVCTGYGRRNEHAYLSYAEPGRQISRFALRDGKTGFLFVFRREKQDLGLSGNLLLQKEALFEVFSSCKWKEWSAIAECLHECREMYFDAAAQVDVPHWSARRVALVGDAAYCPSLLAGEGASVAMAGAYIMAGELERTRADPSAAFNSYERRLRSYMERKQFAARDFASSFVPETAFGLFVRDIVLHLGKLPFVANWLIWRFAGETLELPCYN